MDKDTKDFGTLVTGAAAVYALFVLLVGVLFTLMLFFGKPVEQG